MAAIIYARVHPDLKTATDEYAEERGMTLANAVTQLLELGLQAASDEASVDKLESKVEAQEQELRALRERDAGSQVIAKRLQRSVGKCPGCAKPVSGADLLADGVCPHCQTSLINVLTKPQSEGLDDADIKVLFAALGVFLGLVLLTRE